MLNFLMHWKTAGGYSAQSHCPYADQSEHAHPNHWEDIYLQHSIGLTECLERNMKDVFVAELDCAVLFWLIYNAVQCRLTPKCIPLISDVSTICKTAALMVSHAYWCNTWFLLSPKVTTLRVQTELTSWWMLLRWLLQPWSPPSTCLHTRVHYC